MSTRREREEALIAEAKREYMDVTCAYCKRLWPDPPGMPAGGCTC